MEIIERLFKVFPGRFSRELGLTVEAGAAERQKWFLAAILFGARISGVLAARTYKVFAARGILTPEAILAQGWDNLVQLLDEGGYTRYDYKTATKLLSVMAALRERYQGDLESLAGAARDRGDLEERLKSLAPGLGPVTVNIFLRELRGVWPLAQPPLSPLAQLAATHLKLMNPGRSPEEGLATLQQAWQAAPMPGREFADLEAALVRLGRDFCRKPASHPCPMGDVCGRRPF